MRVYLLMKCGGIRDNLMSDPIRAYSDEAKADSEAQRQNELLADYNPNGVKWWVKRMVIFN